MNVISYHTFAPEFKDRLGRRWCSVCQLPEQNARAKQLHSPIPRARDWRDRAWGNDRDETEEAA